MRKAVFSILCLLFVCSLQAQTKIFREVGEEISTQVRPITQDNALVGYLAFTRLEKANADSFNYQVTIMDENLNEIGNVKFRQENLDLKAVSFEQNVLSLGYVQSPLKSVQMVRNQKEFQQARDAAKSTHILVQFINLEGKILNTYYQWVSLETEAHVPGEMFSSMKLVSYLKYGMQIKNITNSGFCLFYGDDLKQLLVVFDAKGQVIREQRIGESAERYFLHTSSTDIYLLMKKDVHVPEGGYRLFVYNAKDLSGKNNFDLRDADNNWLKVLSFDNDPSTGNGYIAGCIINPKMENQFVNAFHYANSPYLGLFTLDLGGPGKEMHANCSYWSNDNASGISGEGFFNNQDFYVKYATAFRDFKGNTIFAGSALKITGTAKFKLADGVFVRQEPSGKVALDNNIPCDETKSFGLTTVLYTLDQKDFYKVDNPDTKSNYVVIDDADNIYFYNVSSKKVLRVIPHKDGNIKTSVYPAKEGHILVSQYNKKEKYTRFSIETP